MSDAMVRNSSLRQRRAVLAALAGVLAAMLGWTTTADARFTCSSNADCFESAQQCDPGGIPCNDGICDPNDPDASAIGCVLIPNDSNCDDGRFCNGEEFCSRRHGCQPGTPPSCNDGVPCTTDICDEEKNRCTHTALNSRCSNGLFCDGNEVCDPDKGCVAGTPPNCGDGVACTTDSCDESADRCRNVPNNGLCSNGQFCDGVETCTASGCRPGTPPNCGDGVACTIDACNEVNDTCTHNPNNALCNNGSFCDGVEICSPTQGCRPGTAPNCNDGVACTADSCDEANDVCKHVPNNALCRNSQFCDGVEFCSPTKGCQPGTPVNCDDGVSCTIDRCLEQFDRCDHFDNDAACNNGKFCDGVETCDPLLDCQPGTPPNCDDDVDCTIDTCIESSNSCSHRENPAFCDNGLFCDGAERCDPLLGCYFGIPPSCSDNVDCTVDICIEETDSCEHEPSDDLCSNGSFCDGTEQCVPELGGCIDGAVPDCNDDIDCTVDSCSDPLGRCQNVPDQTFCSNGLFCDGSEVCSPTNGCVPGSPPICADSLACTDDSCSEPADMCLHTPNGLLCGNGVVDAVCGEECDEDNGEVCNNEIDDDGDGLVDCADPDCLESKVLETCDDLCRLVPPCRPLQRDPAVISWGGEQRAAGAPGAYSFHARLMPTTPIDPLTEGFVLTLSNANGGIYRAELDAADFKWTGTGYIYRSPDPGAVAATGGVLRLGLRKRLYAGELGYGIRFKGFGDFSRATLATMTTQVYFGDDVGYVTATYGGEPGRWILRARDYDDSLE